MQLFFLFYALLSLPILLIALLISFTQSDELIRPLVNLENATRRIAAGDYSTRLLGPDRSELAEVSSLFSWWPHNAACSEATALQDCLTRQGSAPMTPEAQARQVIDERLRAAGWQVQDYRQLNLGAAAGVAVREYPTDTGPADYVLFVDREAIGVIEAKRDDAGEQLVVTESQTERYATSRLKWRADNQPLPFLFEATGKITRFTDARDPSPRSREVFSFFRPDTLAAWLAQPSTLRRRLHEAMRYTAMDGGNQGSDSGICFPLIQRCEHLSESEGPLASL